METSHANLEYGFCPLRPEKKKKKNSTGRVIFKTIYDFMKMIGTPVYQIKLAHVNLH